MAGMTRLKSDRESMRLGTSSQSVQSPDRVPAESSRDMNYQESRLPPLTEDFIQQLEDRPQENHQLILSTCKRLEAARIVAQSKDTAPANKSTEPDRSDKTISDDVSVLSMSSARTNISSSSSSRRRSNGLDDTHQFLYWQIRLQNRLVALYQKKSKPLDEAAAHYQLARLWAIYGLDNEDRAMDHIQSCIQLCHTTHEENADLHYKAERLHARLFERSQEWSKGLEALDRSQALLIRANAHYHHEQCSIHVEKASIYAKQDKAERSVAILQSCLDTHVPSLDDESQHIASTKKEYDDNDLIRATVQGKLGQALLQCNEPEKAIPHLQEGLDTSWQVFHDKGNIQGRKTALILTKSLSRAQRAEKMIRKARAAEEEDKARREAEVSRIAEEKRKAEEEEVARRLLEAQKAEEARVEAERITEAERLEAQKREEEARLEAERIAEAERLEAQKAEEAKLAAAEAKRIAEEACRLELERIAEAERLEARKAEERRLAVIETRMIEVEESLVEKDDESREAEKNQAGSFMDLIPQEILGYSPWIWATGLLIVSQVRLDRDTGKVVFAAFDLFK